MLLFLWLRIWRKNPCHRLVCTFCRKSVHKEWLWLVPIISNCSGYKSPVSISHSIIFIKSSKYLLLHHLVFLFVLLTKLNFHVCLSIILFPYSTPHSIANILLFNHSKFTILSYILNLSFFKTLMYSAILNSKVYMLKFLFLIITFIYL